MQVLIKKLVKEAVIPYKAHEIDAGYDLTAISMNVVDEGDYGYIEYGTGLAVSIPVGYIGLIFPRSSISKTGLLLANAVGVIDPGYTGEVKCRFKYIPGTKYYDLGERCAQLIIIENTQVEFQEVLELEETERAENGWGSSGI